MSFCECFGLRQLCRREESFVESMMSHDDDSDDIQADEIYCNACTLSLRTLGADNIATNDSFSPFDVWCISLPFLFSPLP